MPKITKLITSGQIKHRTVFALQFHADKEEMKTKVNHRVLSIA